MRVSLAEEADRGRGGESQAGRRAVEGRKGERGKRPGKEDVLVQMV